MEIELKDRDLISIQQARDLACKARQAYEIFSTFPQEQVDKIVESMAKAGEESAEYLARFAVEETDYGKIEDKIIKNIFSTRNVYDSIKDLKTVGVISEDKANKIVQIAHPMGVVCAITPTTNPTSTVMFKAIIAIKSRNAIVFAPHPHAARCSKEAVMILGRAAEDAGAPKNLISCMDVVTLEGSRELMSNKNIAIILATGGLAMVKAAHSCGKPAIGVGPGNTPAYVDRTADLEKAASDLITSKSFDYGVICASEQSIIVHQDIETRFRKIISGMGGFFLNTDQVEKLSKLMIINNGMNAEMVGKAPSHIANSANIKIPERTKLLIAPLDGVGPRYPLSREVLSPIIAYYVASDWEAACKRSMELINFGGLGHTMVIHAKDEKIIQDFALKKPVFRILVNTPSSQGAIGYTTSLTPSMTLSTGTWGGGISTDNISAYHLMNIKRVAYETNPLKTTGSNGSRMNGISDYDIESIVKNVIEHLQINS